MSPQNSPVRRVTVKSLTMALACLALLAIFEAPAKADTLTIAGSSNTDNQPNSFVHFIGRTFSNNFTVTSTGQTFDFVFGQFSITPNLGAGFFGCTDGPCFTLTGALSSPSAVLSFDGIYGGSPSGSLDVDWSVGSGLFVFTTAEGGSGQFTIDLLDFFAVNSTGATQLYDQLARITVTQFTPGTAAPVPEPVTALLLGTGLAAAWAARGRKTRKRA